MARVIFRYNEFKSKLSIYVLKDGVERKLDDSDAFILADYISSKEVLSASIDDNVLSMELQGEYDELIIEDFVQFYKYDTAYENIRTQFQNFYDYCTKLHIENAKEKRRQRISKIKHAASVTGTVIKLTALATVVVLAILSAKKVIDSFQDSLPSDNDIITADTLLNDQNQEILTNIVNIGFADRSNDKKLADCEENYYSIIRKYANMYGLDPKLVLAMFTQERGVHSTELDENGAVGLAQIQYDVWINQSIFAYNFQNESFEHYTVTDENIRNLETNIKIGCMIMQKNFQAVNYNMIAGLQAYEWKSDEVINRLVAYANERGLTLNDVLSNTQNTDWLNECFVDQYGTVYAPLVLSYLPKEHIVKIRVVGPNGPAGEKYFQINNTLEMNMGM